MPVTEASQQAYEYGHAEIVALIAQILQSNKSVDFQQMEDLLGNRTKSQWQLRLKTAIKHAHAVNEDRSNGGNQPLGKIVDLVKKPSDANVTKTSNAASKGTKRATDTDAAPSKGRKAKKTKTTTSAEADDETSN